MDDTTDNQDAPSLVVTPRDRDLMIRTIIGEAGNQPDIAKTAVANVVMNRAVSGKWGKSPSSVVLAPSQFEPWSTRSRELMSYSPQSPQYQSAARVVDGVLSGDIPDITGGMTHFYAPQAQAALGRQAPAWANGQGLQVGAHLFYAPEGPISAQIRPAATEPQPTSATVSQALGNVGQDASQMAQGADTMDAFDRLMATGNAAPAASASASTEPDPFDKLMGIGQAKQKRAVPSDAKPGPNGLMWNAAGGYDPQTGELVIAGKPMTDQTAGPLSAVRSAVAGLINGTPIAGPAALSATEKGAAAVRALSGDTKYSDELQNVQAGVQQDTAAHPTANMAGNIVGSVNGYAGLGATALGARALGFEGPTMLSRIGLGTAGNALLSGADAAARGENPLVGAVVGGAVGAAAPVVGRIVGNGFDAASRGIQSILPTGIPGISRSAANLANQVISADGPDAVQNLLLQHGDQAMLADAGPSLTGITGALALKPSEAKSVVENALMSRAAGATDRISGQIDASLGPMSAGDDAQSLVANIERLRDARTAPMYAQAHANAPPVDIQNTLDLIDEKMKTATGATLTALKNARQSLVETADVPVLNDAGVQAIGQKNVRSTPQAAAAKPVELRDFIKKMGGIDDEGGDLKAMGLDKLRKSGGISLDEARQRAAEAGYIGGNTDDAMANTFTSDLLDALSSEHPVYSVHDLNEANSTAGGYNAGNRGGWTKGDGEPLTETKEIPVTNSQKLHNARKDLDLALQGDTPALGVQPGALGTKNAVIADIRSSLDKNLKTQVPGMAEADAAYAQLADRQNAVDRGYNKILGSNQSPHPDAFAAERAASEPGSNIALNKGIRARVDRMFGTGTQRDAITLNKLLSGGEDGYAAQNLRTAFGAEPVNALVDTLNREKLFNNTTNEVVQNSATARRAVANKLLEETQPGSTFIGNMSGPGMVAQAGKSMIVDPIMKMIMESSNAPRNLELARIMTAQGATRDEILQKLLTLNGRHGMVSGVGNVLSGFASGGANRLLPALASAYQPSSQVSR